MSLTAQTSQPSYITGPQPNVFLGALLSYPTATGTAPTNDGTKLSFASASSQFLNFGSQTFDMTKGFSVTCNFAFTGTAATDEVILNFDSIRLTRSGATGSINFTYYNGATAYSVTSTNTVAQGQVNTVTVFYTHSPVSLSIILNGVTTTSTPAAAATTPRAITNSYVGFPTTAGQNLFVAVAYSSTAAASSTDGINWTPTNPLPSASLWRSVTVNPTTGVFVAIAQGSDVAASSTDGITWTARTLPSVQPWFRVTVNPTTGVFVAVCAGSTAGAYSTDGFTWTPTNPLPSASTWHSVTVNPTTGVFVAVAYGSTAAASSTDGITWTARTLPFSRNWTSVTVNSTTGIFAAVAAVPFNTAAYSTDGFAWSPANPLPYFSEWSSVTCNPTTGIFVAVISGLALGASSTDGITWTGFSLPSSAQWQSVTVNPTTGVFVAVAYGSTAAASSTDGINWTPRTLSSSEQWLSVTASTSVSSGNYLNGDIYSLNIYNRALTPAELSGPPAPSPWSIMSGTPLFSQLSQSARTSAVGAFSLRAVNGLSPSGTAKAVAVQAHPVGIWPPTVLSGFTTALSGQAYGNGTYTVSSSETENGNTNRQSWDLFKIGTESSMNGGYHSATVFTSGGGGPWGYIGTGTTTIAGVPTTGLWIQIQLPTSMVLKSYQIITRTGYSVSKVRLPSIFIIVGSNNGSAWTQLDSKNYTISSYNSIMTSIVVAGETRAQVTNTVSNTTSFLYYRLVVQSVTNGDGIMNFSNFWLYGESPSYAPNPAQDFYADRLGNLLTAPVTGLPLVDWLGGATGYVTTWYDQSGAGNDATQLTAANQPIIQRATKGPGYMVNFNGTSQFVTLSASYNFLNGTNITVNAVALRTATVTGPNYIIGTNSPTVSYQRFFLGYASDTSISMPVTGAPTAITIPAYNASNEPVTYMTGGLTPSRVLYQNDTLGGTNADTALLSVPSGYSYSIGYTVGAATYYYQGNLFEILVFTSALNQTQVTQVYQNQLSYTGT